MMNRTAWGLTLVIIATVAGCASDNSAPPGTVPAPEISSAVFYDSKDHENVFITGAYFKLKSDNRLDVIASLNGRNWTQARRIMDSSSTIYKATIPYGAEYPQVWVRVYGMNGEYSPPFLVHLY
ncbi:MAG TPA: hypothetical protein VG326_15685 [Tepidisphaeraceae bacterium]|jgi:hypothetical protein|nr:hypothetical protein [Tepidisphaeraceae bacterium]